MVGGAFVRHPPSTRIREFSVSHNESVSFWEISRAQAERDSADCCSLLWLGSRSSLQCQSSRQSADCLPTRVRVRVHLSWIGIFHSILPPRDECASYYVGIILLVGLGLSSRELLVYM